ncbi:MAG: hypothetical protein ACRDKT_16750 [Actinomycetota bacterium]
MRDGWYLMNTAALERVLADWRAGLEPDLPDDVVALSVDEALRIRNSGNVPDEDGRSLRLVLHVTDADVDRLAERRLDFEPDYHDAPTWRRPGSKPVNVVPLRTRATERHQESPWWEQPDVRALEEEWRATRTVAGIEVPEEFRSFVFKTVVSLRSAGRDVTPDSIADSVARWLPPEEAERLRKALKEKEPD